jgi:hypothetical protein
VLYRIGIYCIACMVRFMIRFTDKLPSRLGRPWTQLTMPIVRFLTPRMIFFVVQDLERHAAFREKLDQEIEGDRTLGELIAKCGYSPPTPSRR